MGNKLLIQSVPRLFINRVLWTRCLFINPPHSQRGGVEEEYVISRYENTSKLYQGEGTTWPPLLPKTIKPVTPTKGPQSFPVKKVPLQNQKIIPIRIKSLVHEIKRPRIYVFSSSFLTFLWFYFLFSLAIFSSIINSVVLWLCRVQLCWEFKNGIIHVVWRLWW